MMRRFLDRGKSITRFINYETRPGLQDLSNGTAHGGTVINDKDSGPAFRGQGVFLLIVDIHKSRSLVWRLHGEQTSGAFVGAFVASFRW